MTPEIAKAFTRRYQQDGFKRSKASDATSYPRSAKTVENAVRRLSGLWVKLMPKFVASNPWEYVKRPTVPKTVPTIPAEETVQDFYAWLTGRYPAWELLHAFIEVKSVAVCRVMDLCQLMASQFDHGAATLTILASDDKTHRERIIPLDAKLAAKLARVRGDHYLWEKFLPESKAFRPSVKTKYRTVFMPGLLYNAMLNIFDEFPGRLRSHDLRRRCITLTTIACGGNVDAAAQAIDLDPSTARKHYVDAQRAFDGSEVLKRMASILSPLTAKEPPKNNVTGRGTTGTTRELCDGGEKRILQTI